MPGMDPAPPKPAIVAGAAPSGAPSNGTSGQPGAHHGDAVVTGTPDSTKD
jgi:hypothetical protein